MYLNTDTILLCKKALCEANDQICTCVALISLITEILIKFEPAVPVILNFFFTHPQQSKFCTCTRVFTRVFTSGSISLNTEYTEWIYVLVVVNKTKSCFVLDRCIYTCLMLKDIKLNVFCNALAVLRNVCNFYISAPFGLYLVSAILCFVYMYIQFILGTQVKRPLDISFSGYI